MKVDGVTQDLIEKVSDVWPDIAPTWLSELPELLTYCAQRWRLTYEKPFEGLTYHYVIAARDDIGRRVVLKAGIPGESFTREVDVLCFVNGEGMVKLIHHDTYLGLMLQERIEPGFTLAYDENAAAVAAHVMKRFWKPCGDVSTFISLTEWMKGYWNFDSYVQDINNKRVIDLVYRARVTAETLLASMGETVILHGDLHHENMLKQQDGWIAIDPKGLIGEREYEPGTFLRNPFWDTSYHPDFEKIVHHNLEVICHDLQLDKLRVMQWTYVQAVLALIWVFEDHDRISTEMFDISLKMENLLATMSQAR